MTQPLGLRHNLPQFLHQLLQVLLVGLTLGLLRTVVPSLAESEFHVPAGSFVLLTAFVLAFGLVKAALNFVAGHWSEKIGRKKVLLLGWLCALPVPPLIAYAPSWDWVIAATVLLGVNQGLTWSMTQASKLDLVHSGERGLALGLNEFAGYLGVALGGIVTAYLVAPLGAREGILYFGLGVITLALVLTLLWAQDTRPRAQSVALSGWQVFSRVSWRDRRLAAISQAGLVEKFVDALMWVLVPVYLHRAGVSLTQIGWITGTYGLVWGLAQLVTGKLSDHTGRMLPNVAGMWLCGGGVAMMMLGSGLTWWLLSAAVTGLGMALLYPNLTAAIADLTAPEWRGAALGVYRFWRDLGYAIGALGLGLVMDLKSLESAFWFVAIAMGVSGGVLWRWGENKNSHSLVSNRL